MVGICGLDREEAKSHFLIFLWNKNGGDMWTWTTDLVIISDAL